MKGFTHFMSGIAAATFIPEVVRMSTSSRLDTVEGAASSFIILLAGAFGILPDTMDFKLGQFFSIAEYEIDPDPRNPDPQAMTDIFAKAVNEAGDTGKDVRVQLFPIQLGASLWRQYNIIFEPDEVIIQFNEIVKTSQVPIPNTAPPPERRVGRTKLRYELKARTNEICWMNRAVRWLRHKIKGEDPPPGPVKPSTLDILSGTQFAFHKESDGKIYFNWLPWHRTWSHSYVLGFFLSIPIYIIAYLLNLHHWWLYGLVAYLGFFVHLTEDMTGHIGGALFWPFHKPRSEGLELFKASDPRTNFSIDYAAMVLIIYNLDRFSTKKIPLLQTWYGHIVFLLLFLVIPLFIYFKVVAKIKEKLHSAKKIGLEEPDGTGEAIVD
ncbi:MAG TPA: metal-dependent hydrolase [bacterium]|nr:metal-dependent hydrolase [bacterium]HPQ19224.1 metal-dependent hydrolase [bacterium]